MEPLQGWGPPPWSLAPKADALSLALYLLLLRVAHGALAMPSCTEEEFPVGATCCPKCSPGHRVKEACGETTGTVCAPCSPGTYTAHLNGLDECLPCRVCDPDTGLVTRRKCSSTGNTVCGCDRGHFCVLVDGDDCAECGPHSDCRPGQRVQETGTEWQDTVCEDCPPGTFSAGGTQAVCEPWTKCSSPCEMEARTGTNSTDVTSFSSVNVAVLCVCTLTPVTVLLGYLGIRFRKSRGEPTQMCPCGQRTRQQEEWGIQIQGSQKFSRVFPDGTFETMKRGPCIAVIKQVQTAPGPRRPGLGELQGPAPGWPSPPQDTLGSGPSCSDLPCLGEGDNEVHTSCPACVAQWMEHRPMD